MPVVSERPVFILRQAPVMGAVLVLTIKVLVMILVPTSSESSVYRWPILPSDILYAAFSFDMWILGALLLNRVTTIAGELVNEAFIGLSLGLAGLHVVFFLGSLFPLKYLDKSQYSDWYIAGVSTIAVFVAFILPTLLLEGCLRSWYVSKV